MSAPKKFQWVDGPSKPRAPPIPKEKWEEHKAEIIDLYQRTSLEFMMIRMQLKGFNAK